MLFTPDVNGLWDTWIFPHEGKYYLFWLQNKPRGTSWNSIGLAESEDLLHWSEIGTIIEKAPDAEDWLGTGRTWKVGNRFMINFSEFRNSIQGIYFAESSDLRTWTRLDSQYALYPDSQWYVAQLKDTPEQWVRWDCMCPVALDDGYIGFLSAHSKSAPVGVRSVVGAVSSDDGIHWKAIPPASNVSSPLAEVSGYACFGERHYIFVSIVEFWGPRYDLFSEGFQGNGMWYWCSNSVKGPYTPPKHDHMIHGQRSTDYSTHFGTPFRLGDKWLWNHHWTDTRGWNWLATIKELVEESPWHLSLYYWNGNDAMKGDRVVQGCLPKPEYPQPFPERPLCAEWRVGNGILTGCSERATGVAVINIPEVDQTGCMVTSELHIEDCTGDGAGIFVGGREDKPADGLVVLLNPKGRALLGRTCMGSASPRLQYWETFAIPPFPSG